MMKEDMIFRQKIGSDDQENDIIVQELVGRTINQLRTAINCGVVTAADLKQQLKAHFDLALKEYFECRDDPRKFDQFKFVLIGQLKNAFKDFCLDFANDCSAYLSKAGLSFRSLADIRINSKCLPLENLNSILGEVKANIVRQYVGSTATDIDQLNKRLDVEVESYTSENNMRLAKLYNQYNSILEQLLDKYKFLVEARLSDDELEMATDQKLESTLNYCKKTVVDLLNEKMQFDGPEIKSMFEKRIVATLGDQFSEKVIVSQTRKQKKFAEAGDVVNGVVESFKNSLSQAFSEMSDDREIDNYRKLKINELIAPVTGSMYDILPVRKDAKQMIDFAKQKMQEVFDDLHSQRRAETEKFQKQWEAELTSVCESFSTNFDTFCQSEVLPSIEELQAERDILISEQMQNIEWLNAHNNPELLVSFRNVATDQLTALSQTILETHSKLLENNFEQQKCEMTGCLEAFKMKMKDLSTAEPTEDAHTTAKMLGDEAMANFETQVKFISPTSLDATNMLRDDLKEGIIKVQTQFAMDARNRILAADSEISQLVTDHVLDYKQLMGAFSIASNFSKEKLAQIHDKMKKRARLNLQRSLRLAKFSGVISEELFKLERAIDMVHNDAIASLDDQLAEWNQKLESCTKQTKLHYRLLFNRDLGSTPTAADLNRMHENFREQSIAVWEESFPIHYFADKLLPERRKFSQQLDVEFKTSILPTWQKTNSDIDQKTRNAVDELVKRYEEQMNFALAPMDYNSEETISSKHEQLSKDAQRLLNNVDKPKTVNKKVYGDLLSSRLGSTLDCIRSQNVQKKESILNDVWNECLQKKEELRAVSSNWNAFPETTELIGPYVKQLAARPCIPFNFKEELESFAVEKSTEMICELKSEWDNIQPDPNKLQLAINTAVQEYNKEMENRTTKSGQVFNNKAMNKYHASALSQTAKDMKKTVLKLFCYLSESLVNSNR